MKKVFLYILVLAAVLMAPVRGNDVGKLRPVQVISLCRENGMCVIETDTEDRGIGINGIAALQNLKETTPAIIYLDTADFLLLGEGADPELESLRNKLKPGVKLCSTEEKIDLKQAAAYLRVHGNLPRLKVWKMNEKLPILQHFEERLKILKNYEKKG